RHFSLKLAAVASVSMIALPVHAQTTPPPPAGNVVTPFYGNIQPFYGNIQPFYGNIQPFYGNLNPFYGNLQPFWGNLQPFWGNIQPFYGNLQPFWGNIQPFTGANGAPTSSTLQTYWTDAGDDWTVIAGAWSSVGTTGGPADYGVVAGRVTISLDLAKIDRRHGLTVDPEAMEPVTLDLPMPRKGKRTDLTSTLVDDLSKHVFANLPVTMVFAVVDAAGNEGTSAPYEVTLHGKRFFDPLAAALIEMRRDILWNRVNAPRAGEILRAVTNRPEDFIRHDRAFLHLRVLMRDLEAKEASLTVEDRDAIAEKLWTIALMVEEGNLQSALDRLQRAQDRLQEAIENGA
ncbi:DUF4175 family protein, partial [Phenylobacterium sp.]|uniref:DUF4175 family protein n=1 Tax=Phenylobacterium sp. TaxID=1871053 RepID=UPI002736B594